MECNSAIPRLASLGLLLIPAHFNKSFPSGTAAVGVDWGEGTRWQVVVEDGDACTVVVRMSGRKCEECTGSQDTREPFFGC